LGFSPLRLELEGDQMALTIQPLTTERLPDLEQLFASDPVADRCWCMWFIIPVNEYHAAGGEGNRASFCRLSAASDIPLGLLAYQDGIPVGWCAVGPRSRYVRALKTPTYRGGEPGDDEDVWLAPCFFIRKEARGKKIAGALLEAAVRLAEENGAAAVEGFPLQGTGSASSGDRQVGTEALFSACGFERVRTPSSKRVVMRRKLGD
jgi:GNAT superfamily N-acetyltransferase